MAGSVRWDTVWEGRCVVSDVLEIGESERLVPVVVFEVDLSGIACVDRVEPVVNYDVVVGAGGARVQIEYEGNVARMILANPKEHMTLGSRSEAWQLVAPGESGVQYVTRTSPNMEVVELGAGPDGAAEEFQWRLA